MTASKGSNELSPVTTLHLRAPLSIRERPFVEKSGRALTTRGHQQAGWESADQSEGAARQHYDDDVQFATSRTSTPRNAASPSTTVIQSIRPCGTNATWARGIEMESM